MKYLTLSWRRPLSYWNQSIDLQSRSMDWFLYGNGFRLERIKVSVYPWKMKILKTTYCLFTVLLFDYNAGKIDFFNENTVFEWNLKLILCAYTFRRNLYFKKIRKNSFLKKRIFCCSALIVKFFEKYLWRSAICSKLACNALQIWATVAKFKYFITAWINAEQLTTFVKYL